MPEWLTTILDFLGLTWESLLFGLAIFSVVGFFGSIVLVGWVLIRLPADYFRGDRPPPLFGWAERHPLLRWTVWLAKNLLGLILVLLGVLLSLPGIPGQGFLTILVGLLLINFPGKRRLEKHLVGSPRILSTINRIRGRWRRPPLVVDGELQGEAKQAVDGAGSSGSDA